MMEMYCIVSGKVQNVSYRVYIQDSANELGLTGWVRNLDDGKVELCAQGEYDNLKEFVEFIHEGSLRARVEGVDLDWRGVKKEYDDFSILYS